MNVDDIEEIREGYWGQPGTAREIGIRAMFAHIDLQAEQIATLKVALRHALFEQKWTGARGIEPEDIERQVTAQLARQYPEIFGGKE